MNRLKYFLFFQLISFFTYGSSIEEKINYANFEYQKGEQSHVYGERQRAFNRALKEYTEIIDYLDYPSSTLLQAIGNSYFQLNEFSWAILFYEKALKLDPGNSTLNKHLTQARENLGLESDIAGFSLLQKMQWDVILSPGFLMLSFFIMVLSITSLIWVRNKLLISLSGLLASFFLLLIFTHLLNFYFNPIEGILIESTGYYREPDDRQPRLTALPKRAGTKLNILSANPQGSWLKTADSDGLVGYIPASTIRII